MAPTSGNQQPWKFLVVRDKNKINLMKEACIRRIRQVEQNGNNTETRDQFRERVTKRFQGYFSAPVYIIVNR